MLLLVVLLPWSSSVKHEHTPAGTPLISEWFGAVSSAPADAVTSATPTSPLPPCRLIDETDELPATETPATPILDVTFIGYRRSLHLSEGGTTAWTKGGTEALQHVEKNCMVKVEGETRAAAAAAAAAASAFPLPPRSLPWLPTFPCLSLYPSHRGYQRSSK